MVSALKPFALPAASFLFWLGVQLIPALDKPAWGGALLAASVILFLFAVLNNKRLFRRFPALREWLPFLLASEDSMPSMTAPEELTGTYIKGRTFKIADIAQRNRIVRKTFEDCMIFGPGMLINAEGGFLQVNGGSVEGGAAAFWDVPEDKDVLMGVIGVVDCNFLNCEFIGVGIFVDRGRRLALLEELEKGDRAVKPGDAKSSGAPMSLPRTPSVPPESKKPDAGMSSPTT